MSNTYPSNITQYPNFSNTDGAGSVTNFSFTNANGFTGNVATSTTTPNLTLHSDGIPAYDSTVTYNTGNIIRGDGVNGVLGSTYICNTDGTTGAFDLTLWYIDVYYNFDTFNIGIGPQSYNNTLPEPTGIGNFVVGNQGGFGSLLSTGDYNISILGCPVSTGSQNTTVGVTSFSAAPDKNNNTGYGFGSGAAVQSSNNTYLGTYDGSLDSDDITDNQVVISDGSSIRVIKIPTSGINLAANQVLSTGAGGPFVPASISISNNYDGNNLTTTSLGVASSPIEIDAGTILGQDPTTGTVTNTVILNTINSNLNNAIQNISNGTIWYTCQAQATTNITISNPGTSTFDGITLTTGQFLFLGTGVQTSNSGADVGAYVFNGSGVPLTRVTALDTWLEITRSNIAIAGGGAVYGDARYYNANNAGGTIGTTPILYNVWNTAYTGSPTIQLTNNSFSVISSPILTNARAIYGNNFDGSAALTEIIAAQFGGTGNGFTQFSGPTTSAKTFTLPNASATILTDNSQVPVALTPTASFWQQGRLTDTTGTPNGGNSSSGSATLYFTPSYNGNTITLYNTTSSTWVTQTFAEISQTVSGTLTTGTVYDVYISSASSTTVAFTFTAWSNTTTPPTRGSQNGRLTQNGAANRLLVGIVYTPDGTNVYSWTGARYIINLYNQINLSLFATDLSGNYTYASTTIRAANANTTNGVGRFTFLSTAQNNNNSINVSFFGGQNGAAAIGIIGFGMDSTTTFTASVFVPAISAQPFASTALSAAVSGLTGLHFIQRLESNSVSSSITYLAGTTNSNNGISAQIMG